MGTYKKGSPVLAKLQKHRASLMGFRSAQATSDHPELAQVRAPTGGSPRSERLLTAFDPPGPSGTGVLSAGVLGPGTERTIHTLNFGRLWETLPSPQVADCCPVHIPSWYSKGCQSSNPLTERPEGPGPDVQH
ncbi:unnamed protein product [Rangifer tarandus platyrhynchus]|uniref:Uncharacterized protein n=1 Tax=Rangifer tarandus platyrhynchus TaxID=3082113 RepID=A0AC59Y132_RANTA